MSSVALIGLGNIGPAVGERLLEAGHTLYVHNRTPGRDDALVAAGAKRLHSAAVALQEAGVCVLALADDGAVEAVASAVIEGARTGTTLVDTSTISAAASARVASLAAARDVSFLRAPFSGNPAAIRSGKAALFVSGPEAVFDQLRPLLGDIAGTVRYVGEGEEARAVKLALQILIGGTAELLAESIALGEAAGVDRRTLLDVIGSSVIGSTFIGYKTDALVNDDYSATFTTALMRKDIDLVLELATDVDADLPLTSHLRSLLDAACDAGHADKDFISLLLMVQDRTPASNR